MWALRQCLANWWAGLMVGRRVIGSGAVTGSRVVIGRRVVKGL